MCRRQRKLWLLAATAILMSGWPALAQDPALDHPAGYQAITKPSKDVTVSFVRPGRVVEVLASKGEPVKAGQLIARQDDAEEQAALAIDKSESDNTTEIEAEKAVRDKDQVDYDRLSKTGASAQTEIDAAKLEVVVAGARIKIAEIKHDQAILKYQQSSIAVEKLKLLAPVDGVVAEEFLKAGESADGGNMKLVRIVQLDPLWIEVPVPISQARKIKKDDVATVAGSDGRERAGKVIVVSPVADSASDTILVRVELPNPEKASSGESVYVRFGAAPAPAAVQVGDAGMPSLPH